MGYSNWRQDLTEVMTDKEDDKKVTEKNIKNKIVINPKLGEAVEALGGELIDLVEVAELEQQEKEKEEDKTLANKQKKISMVKKQVLLKKMQAVRQGAGADIVAHYEPEGEQIDEKKGCAHTHKGEECPVHGKKECPAMVEETEDSLRDRRMERGGVDGNTNYRKAPPKFAPGPSKKKYDGMSAVDMVKADIRAKYGKGAIIDKKKK